MAFDALNQQTQTTNQVNLLVDEVNETQTIVFLLNLKIFKNTTFKCTVVICLLITVTITRSSYLGTRNERKTKVGTKPCNYDII